MVKINRLKKRKKPLSADQCSGVPTTGRVVGGPETNHSRGCSRAAAMNSNGCGARRRARGGVGLERIRAWDNGACHLSWCRVGEG